MNFSQTPHGGIVNARDFDYALLQQKLRAAFKGLSEAQRKMGLYPAKCKLCGCEPQIYRSDDDYDPVMVRTRDYTCAYCLAEKLQNCKLFRRNRFYNGLVKICIRKLKRMRKLVELKKYVLDLIQVEGEMVYDVCPKEDGTVVVKTPKETTVLIEFDLEVGDGE